jgi:hypothetical protein
MKTANITKTFITRKAGINIKKFPYIIALPVIDYRQEYDGTYPITKYNMNYDEIISCEGEYDGRDCMGDGWVIKAYSNKNDATKFATLWKEKVYSFTVKKTK